MKNKVFIYILIIVLLLGAGAYMWLWPHSVPTNMAGNEMEEENEEMVETENEEENKIVFEEGDMPGWKKYTSEDWGFEIQIPDGWEVEEQRADEDNLSVRRGFSEVGELGQVNLRGDGYNIAINKNSDGIGFGPDTNFEKFNRVIAGQSVDITGNDSFIFFTLTFSEDFYFFRVGGDKLESRGIIYSILDTFRIL